MTYHIMKPFTPKRLASYLRHGGIVFSYTTPEMVLLSNGTEVFCPYRQEPELDFFLPPKANAPFEWSKEGGVIASKDLIATTAPEVWDEVQRAEVAVSVQPTNYLYEPTEGMLLRKFSDGTQTIWVPKNLVDTLNTSLDTLREYYRFDLVTWRITVLLVRFNVNANERIAPKWKPIALFLPYSLQEHEG